MKTLRLLASIAVLLVAGPATAMAQDDSHSNARSRLFTKPIGPIGLDGAPPSPLCRESLGGERFIHCLHNIVWHGGKTYYIDDTKDPPVCADCETEVQGMARSAR